MLSFVTNCLIFEFIIYEVSYRNRLGKMQITGAIAKACVKRGIQKFISIKVEYNNAFYELKFVEVKCQIFESQLCPYPFDEYQNQLGDSIVTRVSWFNFLYYTSRFTHNSNI